MSTAQFDSNGLHIHLDPVGGIAGDMFVAAMLDTFPQHMDKVLADVSSVLPENVGRAIVTPTITSSLRALSFRLELIKGERNERQGKETTYAAMRELLESANISSSTCEAACGILHCIAEAEAEVHNITIDKVHFHEISDWDSLMDVTAAGSICAALSNASWSISPLPLGGGLVNTAHGQLPVPAPATAIILKKFMWHDDGISGERVTPTGAAILSYLMKKSNEVNSGGILCASGMGAGTRLLKGTPNILRAMVYKKDRVEQTYEHNRLVQLACDLDDMTGEEFGASVEYLRTQEGVVDVVIFVGQGKKARPMTRLEVLVTESFSDQVAEKMFTCTSTLGLRKSQIDRLTLLRKIEDSPTGIRRKRALRPDGNETLKAESDELSNNNSLAARREHARRTEME